MRRTEFGMKATAWARNLFSPKGRIAAIAMIACFLLGGWLLPMRAVSQTNPNLKEQVLQIIRENPEVILESVQAYQKKQRQAQESARQAFLQTLQANRKNVVGQSPLQGAKDAKVLLLEFSDFQCPFCGKAQATLKEFMAKHSSQVAFVYKHFPLTSIHPEAMPAAKAAWAAGQQGKFWQYHDALFAQQDKLGDAFYAATAKSLGLDVNRFNRDRSSAAATAAIEQDIQMGEKLGVDGTPFFVMNGETFSGALQVSDLEEVLARVSKS